MVNSIRGSIQSLDSNEKWILHGCIRTLAPAEADLDFPIYSKNTTFGTALNY